MEPANRSNCSNCSNFKSKAFDSKLRRNQKNKLVYFTVSVFMTTKFLQTYKISIFNYLTNQNLSYYFFSISHLLLKLFFFGNIAIFNFEENSVKILFYFLFFFQKKIKIITLPSTRGKQCCDIAKSWKRLFFLTFLKLKKNGQGREGGDGMARNCGKM